MRATAGLAPNDVAIATGSPIAVITYGRGTGSKLTRIDEPACRIALWVVRRWPSFAAASAPDAHSALTSVCRSRSSTWLPSLPPLAAASSTTTRRPGPDAATVPAARSAWSSRAARALPAAVLCNRLLRNVFVRSRRSPSRCSSVVMASVSPCTWSSTVCLERAAEGAWRCVCTAASTSSSVAASTPAIARLRRAGRRAGSPPVAAARCAAASAYAGSSACRAMSSSIDIDSSGRCGRVGPDEAVTPTFLPAGRSGVAALDHGRPGVEKVRCFALGRCLRPQMCDGFRRVGQNEDPPSVRLDDAHTVGGVDLAGTCGFQHRAHHRALCCPRGGQRAAEYGRARDPRIDLAHRQLRARDEPEQPDERRNAVDGCRELGDDEPTAAIAGEHDVGCRRRRGQPGGRRTGPDQVDAVERGYLLGDPRRR